MISVPFGTVYLFRHSQTPTYLLYNSCEQKSDLCSYFLYLLEEAEDVSSTKKQKSKFIIRLKLLCGSVLKMVYIN